MGQLLKDSMRYCRLCGVDSESTQLIFDHPEDSSLSCSLNFFLPIEVSH